MRKAVLILALVLPLLCSCAETFSPSIKITPSLSNVPYTGGSVDITVMTDLPWKATINEDCPAVLSKEYGIGDDVVTVTLPATESWTTGCITVKFTSRSNSATSTKTAYITQEYKPYISVDGSAPTIEREGGLVTLVVTANAPWKASSDTQGVTFDPAEGGVGNFSVTIHIPANTTGTTRRITVNFAIDGDSDHFYLVQY